MRIFGYLAAILTTGAFIPQAYKVIKTKQVRDLSLAYYIVFVSGTICWTIYGFATKSWSVFAANLITTILAGTILIYILKYRSKEETASKK